MSNLILVRKELNLKSLGRVESNKECVSCQLPVTTATEGESEIGCVEMSNVDPHRRLDFSNVLDTYQSCPYAGKENKKPD